MTRKLILISSLVLIAIAAGALIWTRSAKGKADLPFNISPSEIEPSADAQAIRETILRARRIRIEAEYTFDTSQFDTVYINDPRGGVLSDKGLALIREIRQDTTIRKDQVGILDYKKAVIENLKHLYEDSMAELRAKESAGKLTEEERLILQVDTYGWPTPEPVDENLAALATQTCELFIAQVTAWVPEPKPTAAYPEPDADAAYPQPEQKPAPVVCPTQTSGAEHYPFPEFYPFRVPYRGYPPEMVPPEEFEMSISSIEIEGDVARAVVHNRVGTYEYLLVKVDEQWYIADVTLLKAEF
ncbi:MAG: nuclear transport factor 2 family protein [Chloroflexi bacterium]|nr:nuclear transport factor 2 family protein [Chloroflexota bacterium]